MKRGPDVLVSRSAARQAIDSLFGDRPRDRRHGLCRLRPAGVEAHMGQSLDVARGAVLSKYDS